VEDTEGPKLTKVNGSVCGVLHSV